MRRGLPSETNQIYCNRLVEAFSPWCGHCKSLAPKWQTLYEYYYTSDPIPASTEALDVKSSLNSFSNYYDFKFGKLDCVAFGTACNDMKVTSYPALILLKDGEEVKRSVGDKSMKGLSEFVEDLLEMIRPGSRPTNGVKLPEVGAATAPMAVEPLSGKAAKDVKPAVKNEGPKTPAKEAQKDAHLAKASASKTGGLAVPTRTPNPTGKSIAFTADAFKHTVTRSLDGWWVKFYVPWCGHCQELAPVWSSMAKELQGRLNIGEVNCDVEKKLCRSMGIVAYPTIVFFKGTDKIEYDGLRGLGDLIDYGEIAAKASSPVLDVTVAAFDKLEIDHEVIFIYFYDHATTSEDTMALDRLPIHLTGRAKIVKTNDTELIERYKVTTWPTLLVSRSGKPTRYPALAPQDIRDVPGVTKWMQSNWLPLVAELTAANAHEVMDGKLTVLGILSRERSDEFSIAMRELKNAASEWMDKQEQAFKLERQELRDAKQLRIEEAEDHEDTRGLNRAKAIKINMAEIPRKQVAFAWVDGQFWERWIKTTFGVNVKDGERVIINDEDVSISRPRTYACNANFLLQRRHYWDVTVTGNPIVPSRTSILETLPRIISTPPKLTPKAIGSSFSHFWFSVRKAISGHPMASLVLLVACGACITLYTLFRGGRGGGYLQLDGKQILPMSNSPNGKAD